MARLLRWPLGVRAEAEACPALLWRQPARQCCFAHQGLSAQPCQAPGCTGRPKRRTLVWLCRAAVSSAARDARVSSSRSAHASSAGGQRRARVCSGVGLLCRDTGGGCGRGCGGMGALPGDMPWAAGVETAFSGVVDCSSGSESEPNMPPAPLTMPAAAGPMAAGRKAPRGSAEEGQALNRSASSHEPLRAPGGVPRSVFRAEISCWRPHPVASAGQPR